MHDDELADELGLSEPFGVDIQGVVEDVARLDVSWTRPLHALELGSVKWRPHLIKNDPPAVMYVHASYKIRPYLLRRLLAARDSGFAVHIVTDVGALSDSDTIRALGTVEAEIHLLGAPSVLLSRHLLAVLSDESIPVDRTARRALAQLAWKARDHGTSHVKGRRLEALLAFLLSQVDDFRVRERNFRGDTDEIDIVIQLERISNRCWYNSGIPFILVESKNWINNVTQSDVSAFIFKIQTKRGRCKIGLYFARSGYTSDAELQELKLATTDLVLVLVGPDEIVQWIESDDPDDYLEGLVRHAMLR